MTNKEPWFIKERAFAFASLMLTKRNDAVVQHYSGRDRAIKLLIEVLKNGESTMRFFGAQLIGYLDLPDSKAANERVMSHLERDPFEATLPKCAIVVGVRKPEGIYRWLPEHGMKVIDWQPLDEAGAALLIDQVNAWYDDARNGQATSMSHRKPSKSKS